MSSGLEEQGAERPQAARRASEASHPVVPAAADGESSRLKPLLQDQGLAASVAPAWRPRWFPGRLLVPGVLLVQLHRRPRAFGAAAAPPVAAFAAHPQPPEQKSVGEGKR